MALVTGGSRGIGAAIAGQLRESGVDVLVPPRSELDLSNPDSVQKFISNHRNDPIDIIINNAGINFLNAIEDVRPSDWADMLQVNLTAPLLITQGLTAEMRKKKWGRIVNIGSIFGLVTKEKRSAYSATKAGILGLTRTSAVEFGPDGVLVNAVCPGYVDTDLTRKNNSAEDIKKIEGTIPLQRMADVTEIAKLVTFLASEGNTYVTGQSIVIDGGFTIK